MKPFLTALLLAGCVARQDMPVDPPPDRQPRIEGLQALSREALECVPDLRIAASTEVVDTNKLAFRLTNISNRTFHLYDFNLPWGNANAIQVAAVTISGEIVPSVWPIDDPGPVKTVSISPGQTLHGEALLSSKFEDLESYLERTDVLILWSYRFMPLNERGSCVSGIAVATPRTVPNRGLQTGPAHNPSPTP